MLRRCRFFSLSRFDRNAPDTIISIGGDLYLQIAEGFGTLTQSDLILRRKLLIDMQQI